MLQRFIEKYISYSYASSKCPVVCIEAKDATEQQWYCDKTKWWNWASRYCPKDTEKYRNVVCEVSNFCLI